MRLNEFVFRFYDGGWSDSERRDSSCLLLIAYSASKISLSAILPWSSSSDCDVVMMGGGENLVNGHIAGCKITLKSTAGHFLLREF